jgi:hypothetical protein
VADYQLVLVRPDQHIAWVGSPDADPETVFDSAVLGFTIRTTGPSITT